MNFGSDPPKASSTKWRPWRAINSSRDSTTDTVALSFLSFDDNFYELLPYEEITGEEYEERVKAMKPFIPSLISKYEKEEIDYDIGNDGCEGGVCPIR